MGGRFEKASAQGAPGMLNSRDRDLTMPDKEKRDVRTVFLLFSGIAALLAYRHYPSLLSSVLMSAIGLVLLLAAFSPITLRSPFRVWLRAAHLIGQANIKILLFVIYVLAFVPIGLILRLSGRDPLMSKAKRGTSWEPYEIAGIKDKSRYERQY